MDGEDDFDLLRMEWDFDELQNMWTFPDLELSHDSQLLAEVEADEMLDDPPYNVDYEGGTGLKIANDHMGDAQFLEFLTAAFRNAVGTTDSGYELPLG